jgi:hypothetical protein
MWIRQDDGSEVSGTVDVHFVKGIMLLPLKLHGMYAQSPASRSQDVTVVDPATMCHVEQTKCLPYVLIWTH